MPLCDRSTTTCAPFARASSTLLLQPLFLDAERPLGNEVARIGDRRVRKRLSDDADGDAIDPLDHVRREHRIAEVRGAHVLRDEVDTSGEVPVDHFACTRAAPYVNSQ